jgi:thymidine kinase
LCFFSPQFTDIVEFCEELANKGKTIIVAALDGTFQRQARPLHVAVTLHYLGLILQYK